MEETYLVFEFDETELAAQANAQIGEWVKAFQIAFGQLSAGVERQGQGARLIVRLAFDEDEKLAHESWLSRLEREKLFAQTPMWLIKPTHPDFVQMKEHFRELTEQNYS